MLNILERNYKIKVCDKYTKYDLVPFGKFQMGITQFSEYTDFHPTSGGIEKHNRLNFRTGAV